jgi:acyl-coenzyme A thioesterase PaaI-like protein
VQQQNDKDQMIDFKKGGLSKFYERWINFYLPLLGAGIRARRIDQQTIQVEMRLTLLNRNVMGVHFGGSLYAMCDPWYALILMRSLGTDYIVWDKSASIQFLHPGRGKVTANFHISTKQIEEIRRAAEEGEKIEPVFAVDLIDAQGQPVAHVEKILYIRKIEGGQQ